MQTCVPGNACGGQRTALGILFPSSTLWVPRIKVKLSALVASAFTHGDISVAWLNSFQFLGCKAVPPACIQSISIVTAKIIPIMQQAERFKNDIMLLYLLKK